MKIVEWQDFGGTNFLEHSGLTTKGDNLHQIGVLKI
jgi:hypothetical protein